MNILKLIKGIITDINSADIVAYILFLLALSRYVFTDDKDGSLYLSTLALFFFGISFIIDAVNRIETRIVVITDPNLLVKSSNEE
jgi:predicted membrane protein